MTTTNTRSYVDLDVALIDPDPDNQSRPVDRDFVKSIAAHGVVEPILVVEHPDAEGRYLLVAGERRWTGATKAKLATIPAICLLYTSPSPRDATLSRMPSSA